MVVSPQVPTDLPPSEESNYYIQAQSLIRRLHDVVIVAAKQSSEIPLTLILKFSGMKMQHLGITADFPAQQTVGQLGVQLATALRTS